MKKITDYCPAPTKETQALFTLDLAGNFKCVDVTAERLFGYAADELCRMTFADLVAPQHVEYLSEQLARAVTGMVGAVYEIEIYNKDRECIALEISTRLVKRNNFPCELEGIAIPRVNIWQERARCLDEEFWIGPGLRQWSPLTFRPTR